MRHKDSGSAEYLTRRQWGTLLAEQGVVVAVLTRGRDRRFIRQLQAHPGWRVDYRDRQSVVFIRR